MKVAIVGSGPTGTAAAYVLASENIKVDIFDGGRKHEAQPEDLDALANTARSSDPLPEFPPVYDNPKVSDILQRRLNSRRLRKTVLGSGFVFDGIEDAVPMTGHWLPRSLAVGGLSHVWGTACYPLASSDYADWPLEENELAEWYAKAADFFHLSADDDGLRDAYPVFGSPHPVRGSDWQKKQSSSGLEQLLDNWEQNRNLLSTKGVAAGRSRLAVHRSDGTENGCVHCGNCLNGCPVGAMWTSLPVLSGLTKGGAVRHHGGVVKRLEADTDGEYLVSETTGGVKRSGPFDTIILAAGPIASRQIAQASIPTNDTMQQTVRILDNDIYVLPFLQSKSSCTEAPRFTLSEAVMAIADEAENRIFHLQLYRPSGTLLGPLEPIIRKFGLGRLLDAKASQLVLGFLYLHSSQSRHLTARFAVSDGNKPTPVNITSKEAPAPNAPARRAFRRLHELRNVTGCDLFQAWR